MEHNGTDTSEIKCPLYSSQPLHDLDVTVRVIETQNHTQVHISGEAASLPRTCQKLKKTLKNYFVFDILIMETIVFHSMHGTSFVW